MGIVANELVHDACRAPAKRLAWALCAVAALVLGHDALAAPTPIPNQYLSPLWKDADKEHDDTAASWAINAWNDLDGDRRWSKTEPISEPPIPGWRSAADRSCWIASAADMLAAYGFHGSNADEIYWDMIYNMELPWPAPDGGSSVGWQWGGWQHEALNWYLANRPHPDTLQYTVDYYGVYNGQDGTAAKPWPADPFDLAAYFLSQGDEIGLAIHRGVTPNDPLYIYHAVTMQGYELAPGTSMGKITITDSDRDWNFAQLPGDLNDYTQEHGTGDWWLNYRAGTDPSDVTIDYFAVLRRVPAPGSLSLTLLALALAAWPQQRRRTA